MKKFQRYLEHNLSQPCELTCGQTLVSETLISAYQHEDRTRLMALMDHTRRTKLDWWCFTDQHVSIWVKFRAAYESVHVESISARVSTSILPYVREVERNQLSRLPRAWAAPQAIDMQFSLAGTQGNCCEFPTSA